MRRFKMFLASLGVACLCVGCGTEAPSAKDAFAVSDAAVEAQKKEELQPYIVITETFHEDASDFKSPMRSRCIVYDVRSGKAVEKAVVPYTPEPPLTQSGFPVTHYSSRSGGVYYTANSRKGDQIYLYKDGKSDQKKTSMFALINYVIQCGDNYFVAGSERFRRNLEPVVFSGDFDKPDRVFYDEKDDRRTWVVSTMPQEDAVLFASYSEKEDPMKPDKSGPLDIFRLDMKTRKVRSIYKTDQYVWAVAGNAEKLYLTTSPGSGSDPKLVWCYEIDLRTKKKRKLPFDVMGEALWEDTLYFLGHEKDDRGLISYNLKTHERKMLVKQKEGEFMNGFSMNY